MSQANKDVPSGSGSGPEFLSPQNREVYDEERKKASSMNTGKVDRPKNVPEKSKTQNKRGAEKETTTTSKKPKKDDRPQNVPKKSEVSQKQKVSAKTVDRTASKAEPKNPEKMKLRSRSPKISTVPQKQKVSAKKANQIASRLNSEKPEKRRPGRQKNCIVVCAKPLSTEEREKVDKLLEDGLYYREIARELKRSHSTIWKYDKNRETYGQNNHVPESVEAEICAAAREDETLSCEDIRLKLKLKFHKRTVLKVLERNGVPRHRKGPRKVVKSTPKTPKTPKIRITSPTKTSLPSNAVSSRVLRSRKRAAPSPLPDPLVDNDNMDSPQSAPSSNSNDKASFPKNKKKKTSPVEMEFGSEEAEPAAPAAQNDSRLPSRSNSNTENTPQMEHDDIDFDIPTQEPRSEEGSEEGTPAVQNAPIENDTLGTQPETAATARDVETDNVEFEAPPRAALVEPALPWAQAVGVVDVNRPSFVDRPSRQERFYTPRSRIESVSPSPRANQEDSIEEDVEDMMPNNQNPTPTDNQPEPNTSEAPRTSAIVWKKSVLSCVGPPKRPSTKTLSKEGAPAAPAAQNAPKKNDKLVVKKTSATSRDVEIVAVDVDVPPRPIVRHVPTLAQLTLDRGIAAIRAKHPPGTRRLCALAEVMPRERELELW